jgi:hypothetical protein
VFNVTSQRVKEDKMIIEIISIIVAIILVLILSIAVYDMTVILLNRFGFSLLAVLSNRFNYKRNNNPQDNQTYNSADYPPNPNRPSPYPVNDKEDECNQQYNKNELSQISPILIRHFTGIIRRLDTKCKQNQIVI